MPLRTVLLIVRSNTGCRAMRRFAGALGVHNPPLCSPRRRFSMLSGTSQAEFLDASAGLGSSNPKLWLFLLLIYMRNSGRLFLALACVVLWCALIVQISGSANQEGFTFSQCINKGFTKEFCVQTPVSYGGPAVCRTEDGRLGQILAGWGGQCIAPPYSSPYFTPYRW